MIINAEQVSGPQRERFCYCSHQLCNSSPSLVTSLSPLSSPLPSLLLALSLSLSLPSLPPFLPSLNLPLLLTNL